MRTHDAGGKKSRIHAGRSWRELGASVAKVTAFVHVLYATVPAGAQVCDTSCPTRMRDARGCCPTTSPGQSSPSPVVSAPPPTAQVDSSHGRRNSGCRFGQEITADTEGHCCWQGQAWNGSRCVGVPTWCPDGHEVDAAKHECALTACERGRVRTSDGVHCCWPGQAWSSRGACVGTPECPTGTEPGKDSTCVSTDLDNDGILNAQDKCPMQPEDKDGHQDADGCPDPDNDGDGVNDEADKCPNEVEDKNGFMDEDGCPDAEAYRAKKRDDEIARALKARRAAIEVEDERRRGRRTLGWVSAVSGVATSGLGIALLAAADAKGGQIKNGSFSFAREIDDVVEESQTLSTIGGVTLGVGVALVGAGVPLIVFNRPQGEASAVQARGQSLTVRPHGAGFRIGGEF